MRKVTGHFENCVDLIDQQVLLQSIMTNGDIASSNGGGKTTERI